MILVGYEARNCGQEARYSGLSLQLIAVCRAIAAYFMRV